VELLPKKKCQKRFFSLKNQGGFGGKPVRKVKNTSITQRFCKDKQIRVLQNNTDTDMGKQVTSSGTNSQGSSYSNYDNGGYRYSNTNGSSYYSPSGSSTGAIYSGGSSGHSSWYGKADGSRNAL
jgi:hypothetical protein